MVRKLAKVCTAACRLQTQVHHGKCAQLVGDDWQFISYSSKLFIYMCRSSSLMQRHKSCQEDHDDTSLGF